MSDQRVEGQPVGRAGPGRRAGHRRRLAAIVAAGVVVAAGLASCSASTSSGTTPSTAGSPGASKARGRALLVGTYKGRAGQYRTIQAAVDAAKPGDWILVAPGVYHERADHGSIPYADKGGFGGVLISTPNVHLRGMERNTVIVDGTLPTASGSCSAKPADQDLGAKGTDGKPLGRNGIVVWQANGVSVDNLTTCNFLGGAGAAGNEIWWNGGDGSAKIGQSGYEGSYLTATSSYFADEKSAAQYGIFSSNSAGPARWSQLYASNFNDSGMYVGACLRACGITIDHAWMQFSALGYSGTNSGGRIVLRDSEFDHNKDGLDTNTQIAGDPPAPQDGTCPGTATSPITHTRSCWVLLDNKIHDNNNPDVPQSGNASAGPVGTGMTLSGGRNDTVMGNTFSNNGAWGILVIPYPDSGKPDVGQTCAGTGGVDTPGFGCVYDPMGDALLHNTFSHNGFFGNPTNGDYGMITLYGGQPSNCFAGNKAPDGSTPADLQKTNPTCGVTTKSAVAPADLLGQVLCDTGVGTCPPGAKYPKASGVVMHPLPAHLPTMPNPCAGVPDDAWCRQDRSVG